MMPIVVLIIWLALGKTAWADVTIVYPQTAYVYATVSGILRRVVVTQPGEDKPVQVPTQAGETAVVQNIGDPTDSVSIRAKIVVAIGKAIASDKCAAVDSGNHVANLVRCDPALDTLPGTTLVQSDFTDLGDTWVGGANFTRRYAVFDPITRVVAQIANLPVGAGKPVSPIPGDKLRAAGNLKVGDVVPGQGGL